MMFKFNIIMIIWIDVYLPQRTNLFFEKMFKLLWHAKYTYALGSRKKIGKESYTCYVQLMEDCEKK